MGTLMRYDAVKNCTTTMPKRWEILMALVKPFMSAIKWLTFGFLNAMGEKLI